MIAATLLLLAACGSQGGTTTLAPGGATPAPEGTKVPGEAIGEQLMTGLRDGDYASAQAILATGQARDYADDAADLEARVSSEKTQPKTWTFEPLAYETEDDLSYAILEGAVAYADGATGTVRIKMQAVGMLLNPWRVEEFELKRD